MNGQGETPKLVRAMRGRILPPNQQQEILNLALRLRNQIEIAIRCETEEIRLKSHLVPVRNAETALRIQRPTTPLADVLLVAGTRLRVTFQLQRKQYWFLSACLGPMPNSQESLLLAWPESVVEDRQGDRAFYRLTNWIRPPLPVTFWLIGSPHDTAPLLGTRWNGWIDNISVGGVGVRVEGKKVGRVLPGQSVGLFWSFRGNEPPYVMKGVVRNKDVLGETGNVKLGIQFVESFNKSEHQSNLNRLLYYITEQERLLIRKQNR